MELVHLFLFAAMAWLQAVVAVPRLVQEMSHIQVPRQSIVGTNTGILVVTKTIPFITTPPGEEPITGLILSVGFSSFTQVLTYTFSPTIASPAAIVTVHVTTTATSGKTTMRTSLALIPTTTETGIPSTLSSTQVSSEPRVSSTIPNSATPSSTGTIIRQRTILHVKIAVAVAVPMFLALLGVTFFCVVHARSSKRKAAIRASERKGFLMKSIGPPTPPAKSGPIRPQRPASLSESLLEAMRSPNSQHQATPDRVVVPFAPVTPIRANGPGQQVSSNQRLVMTPNSNGVPHFMNQEPVWVPDYSRIFEASDFYRGLRASGVLPEVSDEERKAAIADTMAALEGIEVPGRQSSAPEYPEYGNFLAGSQDLSRLRSFSDPFESDEAKAMRNRARTLAALEGTVPEPPTPRTSMAASSVYSTDFESAIESGHETSGAVRYEVEGTSLPDMSTLTTNDEEPFQRRYLTRIPEENDFI